MAAVGGFNQVGPFQLQPPRGFSGKREDFEEFVFKLKSYLCMINPKYFPRLQALQGRVHELAPADFQDDRGNEDNELIQMATHLQWLLVTLCSGAASTSLRRETTENGFESYRKLCQRYMVPSKARSVGWLSKILKPDLNMNVFEDTFSSWEDEIIKYEKETKTPISDDVKIDFTQRQ